MSEVKTVYREVTITLNQTSKIERTPNGTPQYKEVRIEPVLNGRYNQGIQQMYGAVFGIPLVSTPETDQAISTARDKVITRLHKHIDDVLDGSRSAPWLDV